MIINIKNKANILLLLGLMFISAKTQGQYFPPLNQASHWDTISPASLEW